MPRIADALDRESQSVDLERGDFERLLERRERKQRNRRIRAGAVAVIVALATAALLTRYIAWEHVPATPPKPLGAARSSSGRGPEGAGIPTAERCARSSTPGRFRPPPAEDITGAAWSSDRQWVAFRRGPGSQAGELWVADTVGGAPRQVATDVGWSPWVWSPTGDQLVFVLGRDVTLIDAVTGRETDLGTTVGAKDSEGYAVHALAWSPDGTRIAYDGGRRARSTRSMWRAASTPCSSTGPRVWRRSKTRLVAGWHTRGDHVLDATTSGHKATRERRRRCTSRTRMGPTSASWTASTRDCGRSGIPGLSVGTAWSPDGTRLAYVSRSGPKGHRELQVWTVSANGSAPSLVASHVACHGGDPVWSPDGSQIAFFTEGDRGRPARRDRRDQSGRQR